MSDEVAVPTVQEGEKVEAQVEEVAEEVVNEGGDSGKKKKNKKNGTMSERVLRSIVV